jgi:N-acetylmuramoyl-L-alanine amidase
VTERWTWAAAALAVAAAAGCRAGSEVDREEAFPAGREPANERERSLGAARAGDEIAIAGRWFHTGARVIPWSDPNGYNAYLERSFFQPTRASPTEAPDRIRRYGPARGGLPPEVARRVNDEGWTLEVLQRVVSQVVIHFDACGTSRRCFEVLHDIRGLSCHFLIDLDGTIYQTLDVKERAWHASQANDSSVGIEIANIGAYAPGAEAAVLAAWYTSDARGPRGTPPDSARGPLSRDFVIRPARAELISGVVNSRQLVQYDFTEEQYTALARLLTTLRQALPRIRLAAPEENGRVRDHAFDSDQELFAFEGLLGHCHVTRDKVDPGPAFDWRRVLTALAAER